MKHKKKEKKIDQQGGKGVEHDVGITLNKMILQV